MRDGDVQHVLELLDDLGPVQARPMMGGHIFRCGGLAVALLYDEQLYLKTDRETREAFAAAGGEPFTYELNGKVVEMSYWTPPVEALEAAESMRPWARLALQAAARSRAVPRRRRPPKRREASRRSSEAARGKRRKTTAR